MRQRPWRGRSGFPVVVKSAVPGAHKSEHGGVALDLHDEEGVRSAAARIGGGVIVQPMLSGGAELLAGLVQDPIFGALVGFRAGRRAGRVDRRGHVPHRAADRCRRRGAHQTREGGSSRSRFSWPRRRRRSLDRPGAPARAPRRGTSRSGRGRPEPGARVSRPLCRGRCPGALVPAVRGRSAEELVSFHRGAGGNRRQIRRERPRRSRPGNLDGGPYAASGLWCTCRA